MNDTIHLLKKARGFERVGDIEQESKILKGFWKDFSREPETTNLAPIVKGEVFRLCGKFLSAYAKAKALPETSGYQERGKILLTKAINIFEEKGEYGRAALAKCQIALSYYYDGRSSSADAVLSQAERYFRLDKNNPYYLEIKINQLIALSNLGKINECLEIINFVSPSLENCTDPYLRLMFFNQSGLVFNNAEKHDLAEKSFRRAMRVAEASRNLRAVGQIANNLAYTARKLGDPYLAYDYVRRAIIMAQSLSDFGWMANYLDTKAQIELELGDLSRALETINESINFLSETEDIISHIESLNTKIDILLARCDVPQSLIVFSKLSNLITKEYGETEAKKAAEIFTHKMSSASARKPALETVAESGISRFETNVDVRIFNLPEDDYRLFYVPAKNAAVLGFDEDLVICALNQKKPNPIVMNRAGEFLLGDLTKDDEMDLTVLYTGRNQTDPVCITPEEADIEGSVCAVALLKNLVNECLYFEKLEKLKN